MNTPNQLTTTDGPAGSLALAPRSAPSFSAAYQAGYDTAKRGSFYRPNPYPTNQEAATAWDRGYEAYRLDKRNNTAKADELPPVLDACCGSRSMWFDRSDRRAIFVDKRRETLERSHADYQRAPIVVNPDMLCDFAELPFPDEAFWHVVFDPPHVIRKEALGNVTKFYGCLNGDWREMLRNGFVECFRVLKPGGTLVFKWTETQIPLREILALTPERPLYGHQSGAKARTHWCAFLKPNT